MNTGTIYNTLKLQSLNSKWMQKKDSGNVLSKAEQEKRENWTAEQFMVHNYQQQLIEEREASKKREIANKITAGGNLSPEEEQYLEQNDPVALKRYRDSKVEKKTYEEKLNNCKTKDEVERLKNETVSGYLATLKKVENNPYVPISEKLAIAEDLLSKTRNIEEAETKFKASAAYQNLPTEAEEAVEATKERENDDAKIKIKQEEQEMKEKLDQEELTQDELPQVELAQEKMDSEEADLEKTNSEKEDSLKKQKTVHQDVVDEIEIAYSRIKLNFDFEQMDDTNLKVKPNETRSKINFLL